MGAYERSMLEGNDYFTDVAKGNVAYCLMEYRTSTASSQRCTALGVPSRILIDIESTRTGLAELPPAKAGLARSVFKNG
jgi:hypothetical protein